MNSQSLKPHEAASLKLSNDQGVTNVAPASLIYKDGVPDTHNYTDDPDKVKTIKKKKPHVIDEQFKPMYDVAKLDMNNGVMQYGKLKNILRHV